ncbi:hypothetical protein FO440_00375 [Mucilaginibacter corticis]|uniref:Porin family protein n=1 Tax=Mucilaginibacter corticis TaxID=2597670 RepID=A0A556MS79_9SPHI|nr:hypothetical protein [Mucilaginibacter corticis]TSJ42682.1 hypothetical protein FO440_00375 [Mucilaginibacter corticis]
MKKFLLAVALIAGVSVSSFAQKKSDDGGKFSIGVEAGLPVGDASDAYNFVIGGSLKYAQPIADATAFTISAGYSSFMGKSVSFGGVSVKVPNAGFVPVKAGIKYNFAESFYGEAQLGAAFGTQSGGGTAFVYAPGIGYDFGGGVDLGVRYEGWSHNGTVSQIAARLAYSF